MSATTGFVAGAVGLSVLSVATSSAAAGARTGGLVGAAVSVIRWIVDPRIPAIPQRGSSGPTQAAKTNASAVGHAAEGYPYPDIPQQGGKYGPEAPGVHPSVPGQPQSAGA